MAVSSSLGLDVIMSPGGSAGLSNVVWAQQQCGPWIATWPQLVAQTMDSHMAQDGNRNHKHLSTQTLSVVGP